MNEQERICMLISRCGSAKEFSEATGISESSVSKLRAGKFRIQAFAERIAVAFPRLNCRWLLTGAGVPFSDDLTEGEIKTELRELRSEVGRLADKVGRRK